MLWLDLAVGCLLMWGAVTGYHAGWRKASYSLGGLLCAAAAALLERADLRIFLARHSPVEETIEAMVNSRLALPVSGGGGGLVPPGLDLPGVLREALNAGTTVTAAGDPQLLADLLVQMLSCTAAFLIGFGLWWGFFHLCGVLLSGRRNSRLSGPARWGGALVGLVRQCCCAALLIGTAAPLAWLWGIPSDLLQLEKTLLSHWGWQLFACLEVWF